MFQRYYTDGETLQRGELLATCGRCHRTIVVRLNPAFIQEFFYCDNRNCVDDARDEEANNLGAMGMEVFEGEEP